MRNQMFKISLLFVLLFGSSTLFASAGLSLSEPWVRQAPPTAKNLAGYGELKNTSDKTIKILSISSELFEKVEMHITTFEKGMMRMTETRELTLNPGDSVYFEPGGRHFMLIKPKTPIKAGLIVPISVRLDSGEVIDFKMDVRR